MDPHRKERISQNILFPTRRMGIEWGEREWIKGWVQEYKVKTAIVTIKVCSFPQEPVPRKDSWWATSCSHCCLSHENPLLIPVPSCRLWQMVASYWTLTEQSKKEPMTWDSSSGAGVWGKIHSQHSRYENCSKSEKYLCDCLWQLQIKIKQRHFKSSTLFWLMHVRLYLWGPNSMKRFLEKC